MHVEILTEHGILIENSIEKGEIIFKGPQITNGYLNDKEKTNLSFVHFKWDDTNDIWYKSGDIGFRNQLGLIECCGRIDSQIKIGGRRIEIGEIESKLSKFGKIGEIVVVSVRNDLGFVEYCVGFIIGELLNDEYLEVKRQSSLVLDTVFFPKRIFKVEYFPRTNSGKVDRKSLGELAKELMG
jgi:acyl-coenzyme A synthetase/AMP-(fatty) acid ligase